MVAVACYRVLAFAARLVMLLPPPKDAGLGVVLPFSTPPGHGVLPGEWCDRPPPPPPSWIMYHESCELVKTRIKLRIQ